VRYFARREGVEFVSCCVDTRRAGSRKIIGFFIGGYLMKGVGSGAEDF
jgi:hypothetical protein